MPNPENLSLIEGETEIHINPLCFSVKALREIMRFQIFRDDAPVKVITKVNEKIAFSLPASEICKARRFFGKDRKQFLDLVGSALHDAKEIIILRGTGVNISATNKPHDPRYSAVFEKFINSNPLFTLLDR